MRRFFAVGYFTVGHFVVKKMLVSVTLGQIRFFFTANCPTPKYPRAKKNTLMVFLSSYCALSWRHTQYNYTHKSPNSRTNRVFLGKIKVILNFEDNIFRTCMHHVNRREIYLNENWKTKIYTTYISKIMMRLNKPI